MRDHDVAGLAAGELERAKRELRVSLALARPDSPARVLEDYLEETGGARAGSPWRPKVQGPENRCLPARCPGVAGRRGWDRDYIGGPRGAGVAGPAVGAAAAGDDHGRDDRGRTRAT